jgi:dipeptidyl aminopeptidase/acylaminoacyl peptidase
VRKIIEGDASVARNAILAGFARSCPAPLSLIFGLILWLGGHCEFTLAAAIDDPSHDGSTTPSRAISALDLVQLRDIGTRLGGRFALSPDGEKIALLLVAPRVPANGYDITWLIVPTHGKSPPTEAGTAGDVVLSEIGDGRRNGVLATKKALWSPDGLWFAYLLKRDGAIQIWRSSRDGTVQAQVTHNAADVIDFRWSRDSSNIFFLTARNRALTAEQLRTEAAQGYLYDRRFWPGHERYPLSYGCRPNWLIQAPAPPGQACPHELSIVSADGADERQAQPSEQSEYEKLDELPALQRNRQIQLESIRRAPNQRDVAWLENSSPAEFAGYDPPLTVFAAHSPDGLQAKRCAAEVCTGTIDGVWWDANRLIILRSEGHSRLVSALYSWEPDSGKVHTILRTPDYLSECAVAHSHAICLHEGPTAPGTIVSISLRDGTTSALFDPNPDLRNLSFSKVEKLEWDDGFGNDAAGHLVYPRDYSPGRRYPLLIVQYRSRGFLRGGVGDEYPVHVFAANGFAVLSFDEPEDRQTAARAHDVAADMAADYTGFRKQLSHFNALNTMIDDLITRGLVDPKRVGITGLSDGAENVIYALIHSSKFAAAAVSTLLFHPSALSFTGSSSYRKLNAQLFGDPLVSLDKWRELSIGLNADRIHTPLLAQVADRELMEAALNVVPLQDAGRAVEMYVFPNEYHVKWQPVHRLAIYNRNLDWFRFWLQDYEDPNPAKIEQYVRWRQFRDQQRPIEPDESGPH